MTMYMLIYAFIVKGDFHDPAHIILINAEGATLYES